MLDAVHCMTYVVYCILYGICCTRYALCCMMYAVWCMLYIVYLMLYVGSMLYAVCFTMLFNVSYCNVLRRFWRQIASFQEGEILSFLIFFFLFVNKIARKFSLEILTEFSENLLKNQSQVDPKSLKISPKWGPGGILGRPWALLGAQEGSGSIFDWFFGPFWDPFWS